MPLAPAPGLLTMDAPANTEMSTSGVRIVWISAIVLVTVYVVLFFSGTRFFVFKTAVLPLLLVYTLVVRNRLAFVTDWLPLLSITVLFDAIRGAIFIPIRAGEHVYYLDYVISWERAVFGVPALSLTFQGVRTPALDMTAVLVHASHFAFFLLFGLALWHGRRDHFRLYRRTLVLVMVFGLLGYAVIPTVPPWMAAGPAFEAIPPLPRIMSRVYTLYVPELYGTFDTNPVAAMPSLHAAFPTAAALVGLRAYGWRAGTLLVLYALTVMSVIVYLGEHYGVDVIAGVLVAVLAVELARRMTSLGLSVRATFVASAGCIALTVILVTLAR